jgi:hypothetical protein
VYRHSGWETVVALSPDQLVQLLLKERGDAPCALLIARASEPVLPPELSEATERAAEVVYLVNLPLEGDTP